MARLIILGATGSLGRHVLRQALAGGHRVTVLVRNPFKLPPDAQSGSPFRRACAAARRDGRPNQLR